MNKVTFQKLILLKEKRDRRHKQVNNLSDKVTATFFNCRNYSSLKKII